MIHATLGKFVHLMQTIDIFRRNVLLYCILSVGNSEYLLRSFWSLDTFYSQRTLSIFESDILSYDIISTLLPFEYNQIVTIKVKSHVILFVFSRFRHAEVRWGNTECDCQQRPGRSVSLYRWQSTELSGEQKFACSRGFGDNWTLAQRNLAAVALL